MESQDGQQDRILRGCTQPTGAGFAGAGGWSARQWCFGGGGWSARPPVVLWRRRLARDRRAHALRLLRAPGGSAAGRCVSELSHGRQTAPAPRPLVAGGFVLGGEAGLLYQQVTEQRQQNPDSRLKWETVEAAYKETLQRFQRRTTRSSRGGPFLPMEVWLRRGFTEEQVRKGDYEEHPQLGPTYQLEIHDQGPAASPALRAEAGGPASQVSSSRQASSQRSGRQAPSQPRQPPQLPASFQALSCQTPQRPCRCQPAPCAVSHQRPCRCQAGSGSASSAQRPCRCQAGSCSASSAQRPCRCQLALSAQRSCRSSQAMRDASRIALNQHFCARPRDFVYICLLIFVFKDRTFSGKN